MGQLREFFGPIEYFIMEDEDKDIAIKCWLQNGILHSQKIKLHDFISGNISHPATSKDTVQQHATPEEHIFTSRKPQNPYESQKTSMPDERYDTKPANTPRQESIDEPLPDEQVKKPSKPKWNMFD